MTLILEVLRKRAFFTDIEIEDCLGANAYCENVLLRFFKVGMLGALFQKSSALFTKRLKIRVFLMSQRNVKTYR